MQVCDCHILRIFQQSSHIFLHKIAFLMAILIFIVFLLPTEQWGAGMVICLERGADLHMAQLMPLPLTVSCFSKIKIGFTFLVPAHLGSPGKRAVKRVCVCVCSITYCYYILLPRPSGSCQENGAVHVSGPQWNEMG